MIRPNLLVVMADQLAPQFLPCYGHPIVQAPTIERLASDGVVFDAAYTNSPLCAPSRFVMMSSRLPSRIGAWDNAVEFPAEIPTFAHYLAAEGCHTCLSGKMHFVGPDQLHGFAQRLTSDIYPADFTWHPEWDRPEAAFWLLGSSIRRIRPVCGSPMPRDDSHDGARRGWETRRSFCQPCGPTSIWRRVLPAPNLDGAGRD